MSDPGCTVDIPGALYSLSWCKPKFKNVFPEQPEILEYLQGIAQKHDVPRHVVYRTAWEGAQWCDMTSTWLLRMRNLDTGDLYIHRARVLISAVGIFSNPKNIHIDGLENFEGDVIHTAQWNHSVALKDKKVVVIGNGCKYTPLPSATALTK